MYPNCYMYYAYVYSSAYSICKYLHVYRKKCERRDIISYDTTIIVAVFLLQTTYVLAILRASDKIGPLSGTSHTEGQTARELSVFSTRRFPMKSCVGIRTFSFLYTYTPPLLTKDQSSIIVTEGRR